MGLAIIVVNILINYLIDKINFGKNCNKDKNLELSQFYF